jgi:phosphoserine phosphatase SerB
MMITVVIPALNEESTIAGVVALAKRSPNVAEVIVVDDKSLDNTVEEAKKAGAIVITSTRIGKGASMKDAVFYASGSVIVFLDAHITTYPQNVVQLLTEPLLNNRADFCKACFSRQAGRVTELVVKPLLSILYPSFPSFWQPLSGMVAGRTELFRKIQFEESYGVEIGLLLDMYQMGARIEEVSIGYMENTIKSTEQLGKMSREVADVILKKSKSKGQTGGESTEYFQQIREQMEFAINKNFGKLRKIAIFDMDNTFLRGSFIQTAAEKFNFKKELIHIVSTQLNPFIRTKQIARLLKGRNISELLKVADAIPVTPGAAQLVEILKENGFIVGLISDSYDCITNHMKNRFGLDFSLANELEFSRSVATGEVKIPSFFLPHDGSICDHEYCKSHALAHICARSNAEPADTLMIGDGENDICIMEKSGIGISFCSTNRKLDSVADMVINEPDFKLLLPII